MLGFKTGLMLTAIATIGLIVYYENQGLEAKPENIKDCKPNGNYDLERISFEVDKDIVPGKRVTMTATFRAKKAGDMKDFTMSVYKGIKLWT